MTWAGPYALFLVTAASHILITAYALVRSRQRAAIPAEQRDAYAAAPTTTSPLTTPESIALDPRAATAESANEERRI
jgi:hypothetical protein